MDRPRLSARVKARRHLSGDAARVILHAPDGRVLAVGDREWRVIAAMDGSRDAAGVAIASGVAVERVTEFVAALGASGLLADDDAPEDAAPAPAAFAADKPVRPLPGYGFRCDGSGGCCGVFGTVAFTPLEAARARAARPDVLDAGQRPDAAFLPHAGLDETLLAVAMRDGACAYLDPDGRCGIHAAAGAAHKPFGCRTFPMRYVDVGREIRVAPRPECACVFDPAGDAPITTASRGSELPRETFVPRLPERIDLGGERVDPATFIAWCDALDLPDPDADLAKWCDAQAEATRGRSSSFSSFDDAHAKKLREQRGRSSSFSSFDESPRLDRFIDAAGELDRRHADWRSEHDLVRRSTGWVLAAACRLRDDPTPPMADPATEHLYVRAALFVGALADAPSVEAGLRQLALHLRIARAFDPATRRAEPAARHPIALVEALCRGHGLA